MAAPTASVRVRHETLGTGWLYPELRTRDGHRTLDFCVFDPAPVHEEYREVVWAYVPTRDLHGFGVQPRPRT